MAEAESLKHKYSRCFGRGVGKACLWHPQNGQMVHPDAPAVVVGQDFFVQPGFCADPFAQGMPHPLAPATRNIDPLASRQIGGARASG